MGQQYVSMTLTDIDVDTNKVNGGTPIYLNATTMKYSGSVFSQASPVPGKSIAQDYKALIPYGDSVGFETPKITITGIINLGDYTLSDAGGTPPTNQMTMKMLLQIQSSGHLFKIIDKYIEDDNDQSTWVYRTHSLTGTFPNETLTTVSVKCIGLSLSVNTSVKGGQKIDYNIDFIEVRG